MLRIAVISAGKRARLSVEDAARGRDRMHKEIREQHGHTKRRNSQAALPVGKLDTNAAKPKPRPPEQHPQSENAREQQEFHGLFRRRARARASAVTASHLRH
jgi:hypothetical protein